MCAKLLDGWDPNQNEGRWIQSSFYYPVFMNNPDDETYDELLGNAFCVFTDELFTVWLRDQDTKDLFSKSLKLLPVDSGDFDEKNWYEWSEDFREKVYTSLKMFVEKQNQMFQSQKEKIEEQKEQE